MSTQTTRRLSGAVTLMALGACLFGAPSGAHAQTAEEIIAANIAASGGAEAIARIKNFRNTGSVTVESPLFGKLEGTLEAVRVPGRGYYEHVVLGPIQQSKGWDGTRGWEQNPTGLRMLEGVELASLKAQSFVNPFVALRTLAPAGLRIERLADAERQASLRPRREDRRRTDVDDVHRSPDEPPDAQQGDGDGPERRRGAGRDRRRRLRGRGRREDADHGDDRRGGDLDDAADAQGHGRQHGCRCDELRSARSWSDPGFGGGRRALIRLAPASGETAIAVPP